MRTLTPIDQAGFEAWARATFDIPADTVALKTGQKEGRACVWVQRPKASGSAFMTMYAIDVPQYASMDELRAAFPVRSGTGQMLLDL